jgi:hypothetical protein
MANFPKHGRNQWGCWERWRNEPPPDSHSGSPPWLRDTMPGETPEQRAFRRFPINVHKPGDCVIPGPSSCVPSDPE